VVESTLTSDRSTPPRPAASAIRPSNRASKTPAYVDENGVGHDVPHLYAASHTTTGTSMDDWDWPEAPH
jgi:hypothetical protein